MSQLPELKNAIPVLPVIDIDHAVTFYEQKLGFCKTYQTGPDHAILKRDRVEIHLWRCDDKTLPRNTSCRINVIHIAQLYAEYQQCQIIHPNGSLATKPWGMNEFVALDLDGNGLFFQEPT